MIRKQTVLVLGAGASAPFGFPTGYQLLQQVLSMPRAQVEKCGFDEDRIDSFRLALQRSGRTSVDEFLENRPDFMDIGKLVIALALIPHESDERLFDRQNAPSWYDHLFDKLNAPFDAFTDNRLTVITFNYDRSLEWYLYVVLSNAYKLDRAVSLKAVKSIPIVHVHGQLGPLSYSDEPGRAYNYEPSKAREAASGIKVVHEAEKVYFIGFAYHAANVKRLRIDEIPSHTVICGSAYGMTGAESQQAKTRFNCRLHTGDDHWDALAFLRNFEPLDD